jgi:hypothetical protein
MYTIECQDTNLDLVYRVPYSLIEQTANTKRDRRDLREADQSLFTYRKEDIMKCPECGTHTWLSKKCIKCGYEFKPSTSGKTTNVLKSDTIPLHMRFELYLAVIILFSFFAMNWISAGPLLNLKAYKVSSVLYPLAQAEHGDGAFYFPLFNWLWIAPVAALLSFTLSYNGKRKIAFWLLNFGATAIIFILGYYLLSTEGQSLEFFGIGAWLGIVASLVAWIAYGKYKRDRIAELAKVRSDNENTTDIIE